MTTCWNTAYYDTSSSCYSDRFQLLFLPLVSAILTACKFYSVRHAFALRVGSAKRKHGGHEQKYYYPQEPIYDIYTFLQRYGEDLRGGQREKLEKAARKRAEKLGRTQEQPLQREHAGQEIDYDYMLEHGLL